MISSQRGGARWSHAAGAGAGVIDLTNQLNAAIYAGLGCPGAGVNGTNYYNMAVGAAGPAVNAQPIVCGRNGAGQPNVIFSGYIPPFAAWTTRSMQMTAVGGMPHPSLQGAAQLGATYAAALNAN